MPRCECVYRLHTSDSESSSHKQTDCCGAKLLAILPARHNLVAFVQCAYQSECGDQRLQDKH